MSAILKGNLTSLIKQPGSEFTVSKTGVATLTEMYRAEYNFLVANAPTINSNHPTYANLSLSEKKITREEGDIGLLSLKYEGLDPASGNELPDPVYELIRGTSSEPIDTHPDFVDTIGGNAAAPENDAVFDDDFIFKNFPPDAGNNLGGVQSYLAASMTFKKTYVDYGPPSSTGAIPRIENPPSPAPTLSDPMNWIFLNQSWVRRGALYEIQKDWMASGKRGWNSLIYP